MTKQFLLATLKAFAQIGDWKSVTQVRKLAAKAKRDKVREAAKDCLPFLEELATKAKSGWRNPVAGVQRGRSRHYCSRKSCCVLPRLPQTHNPIPSCAPSNNPLLSDK